MTGLPLSLPMAPKRLLRVVVKRFVLELTTRRYPIAQRVQPVPLMG
jgi:hypothetical protein